MHTVAGGTVGRLGLAQFDRDTMKGLLESVDTVCLQAELAHDDLRRVTVTAGFGDIQRIHLAGRIEMRPDIMFTVTVGAGRRLQRADGKAGAVHRCIEVLGDLAMAIAAGGSDVSLVNGTVGVVRRHRGMAAMTVNTGWRFIVAVNYQCPTMHRIFVSLYHQWRRNSIHAVLELLVFVTGDADLDGIAVERLRVRIGDSEDIVSTVTGDAGGQAVDILLTAAHVGCLFKPLRRILMARAAGYLGRGSGMAAGGVNLVAIGTSESTVNRSLKLPHINRGCLLLSSRRLTAVTAQTTVVGPERAGEH